VGINVFDGSWHCIVGTYSAAGTGIATIYLDGKMLSTHPITDQPAVASPVRIGYWIDTVRNLPFTRSLGQIAVHKSALTADQVTAHFNAAH
jgi:hypothetical protein